MNARSHPMSPRVMRAVAVVFYVTVLALLTFGFVMLTSTSSCYPYRGDAFYFAKRQALWLGLGLAACAVTACVDYRRYRKVAWPLFIGAVILLVGVLILGRRINGATRWIVYGPFRFQPSEFAKYVLVIVLACWLEKMQRTPQGQSHPQIQRAWWGVFAPIAITSGPALLILLEPRPLIRVSRTFGEDGGARLAQADRHRSGSEIYTGRIGRFRGIPALVLAARWPAVFL